MSLLGRLEDLSLTDIIQIVFLSRRTGVLEIIDSNGRHSVIFHQGLIVNATSPTSPDLGAHLVNEGKVDPAAILMARRTESAGIPFGSAILDMNLLTVEELGEALHEHTSSVITPLLASRDGEFNFILSDTLSPLDIEYEPQRVFREGGIQPSRILGEGEKLKPLRGLEESMRAGKELLRGGASSPATGKLDLGFSEDIAKAAPPSRPVPPQAPPPEEPELDLPPEPEFLPLEDEPFDLGATPRMEHAAAEELVGELSAPLPLEGPAAPAPLATEPVAPAAAAAQPEPAKPTGPPTEFRVAVPPTRGEERLVLLFQQDPLLRVSARRAFNRRGITSAQYGSIEDASAEVSDLLKKNRYFVTFLDLGGQGAQQDSVVRVLEQIKRVNHHLPVVVVDRMPDLRRRHDLLKFGADLYLTKPSESHLQPGMVEEQLGLFADELVLFAQRSFAETAGFGESDESIYQAAGIEQGERSSQVLMQLINELSDPNDISQVSETILRLAGQYLERGMIFATATVSFIGLAGFGSTGGAGEMNERARSIRIGRAEPSVLQDVADQKKPHRGKLRRTSGNVRLVEGLGTLMPSEVMVLPILNKEEVVGVLYGDNAEQRTPIEEVKGLEIFLSQAGFALRNAMIANRGRYGLE